MKIAFALRLATLVAMMAVAAGLCFVFTVGGLAISYGPELPAGATVIELAGAVYLLLLGGKWLAGRRRRS